MGNARDGKKYILNNKNRSACSLDYAIMEKWQNIASEYLFDKIYCYFSE